MLKTFRKGQWFHLIIPTEWAGKTIDNIFREIWRAPKKITHQFRMENKVMLGERRPNWNIPLTAGSILKLELFETGDQAVVPTYQEIDVLFEDDHLLVVNKPAHQTTHPNNPAQDTHTLLNGVAYYLQAKGEISSVRHIHRLDQDTTGAILFAKHPLAGAILDQMLEKREVKRTYIAAVHGLVKQKRGMIDKPIGVDRHHPTRRRVSPTGQTAVTHFEVLQLDKPRQLSVLKCWLETGRTHQIRVHLSYLNHPLVGDTLYGGQPLAKRQALHAAKLEFIHPFTQKKVICHAPLMDLKELFGKIDVETI